MLQTPERATGAFNNGPIACSMQWTKYSAGRVSCDSYGDSRYNCNSGGATGSARRSKLCPSAVSSSGCVIHVKIASVLVVFVLIGLMTLSSPAGFVLILEAFKPEVRATSLGIIYALGVTIFGGFAQLIVSALWRMSGSFYAPAWYVLACGLVSFAGVVLFKEAK
ncbi:MFS transporter [Paraburkholderia sediminicola]|uniref:hypothetical protein n=1 Tax=Paraburkholderia sediminicola TaxID=458836 RepID=UPI0038BD2B64